MISIIYYLRCRPPACYVSSILLKSTNMATDTKSYKLEPQDRLSTIPLESINKAPSAKPYKLEPQDRLSRVPNLLAFIIYRVLPIGGLSIVVYGLYLRYGFFDCSPFVPLMIPVQFVILIALDCARCHGVKFEFEYTAEESPSREAWADMLRARIESYEAYRPRFPFGFDIGRRRTPERVRRDIQCQKERLATYLSGSRQGIPSIVSGFEQGYICTILQIVSFIGLRLICHAAPEDLTRDYLPACFIPRDFSFGLTLAYSFMLWILYLIQYGRWRVWYHELWSAARAIRTACEKIDQEKGGDTRQELEWWIEAILREEDDSPALAEERREVVIAPIIAMIRLGAPSWGERLFIAISGAGGRSRIQKGDLEEEVVGIGSVRLCPSCGHVNST